MEEQSAPEAPAAPPAAKGRGMWIGIVVVAIVIIILLAAVFGGLFRTADTRTPQAVYHIGYPGDAIKYLPSLWANRAQWTAAWFFSEGLRDQTFISDLETAGVNVSQIEGTAPVASTDPQQAPSTQAFTENYTTRFGDTTIGLFAAEGYDGIFVMSLAMALANTTDTNSQAFKDAMRNVSNPPGALIRPGQWTGAMENITAGNDIDYQGASSAVNFDEFGEIRSDYEVWGPNATGDIVQKRSIPDRSWEQPAPPAPAPGLRGDALPRPLQLSPKFGTVLSMTGGLELYGPDIRNATILAAEQINAQGGIGGGTISLVHEDDGTDPTIGQQACSKLVNTDNVDAILGSLASSVSNSCYQVASPAGVAMLSPASTWAGFTGLDTLDLFWRTAPSDALQGEAAAWYAYVIKGWRTVSIFHLDNLYGTGLGDVFEKAFETRGGVVLRNIGYTAGRPSYDSELGSLFTPGSQGAPPAPVSRRDP